ncbi:MAG TPA: putative toxin-antitoxin system toxin component, PIN family [Nitrososphaera sp.]|nr:putative toxin-antitoxin system toxin component, PIN family [Nitrososphaera sp.]
MKIVLDTNVLISALIKPGKSRQLLSEVIKRRHELILSEEILAELTRVANEAKIRKYVDQRDISEYLQSIVMASKVVKIVSKFQIVMEDPDDDIILQTAYDAGADYVVSGDRHLLSLEKSMDLRILSVEEMLSVV